MVSSNINRRLILSALATNLLAFATGNAYAWSSTVLESLSSNDSSTNPLGQPITSNEKSWIAALISLGASLGPILAGYCSDRFGRKKALITFAVPMMCSHFIISFARSTWEFYIARLMMGLGAGCVFTVIPMYIGEIAETETRGMLSCFMAVLLSLGLLAVYTIGPLVSVSILSYILMVPIASFLIFFGLFVPESPYFYLAKGDRQAAEKSLSKLRNDNPSAILKELVEIREVVENSTRSNSLSESLKAKNFRKGIIITTSLMVFQQFVGITAVLSYMESIFNATGTTLSPSLCTVIVAVIQTVTVILVSPLVDTWGRRSLLIISSGGTALPAAMMGCFFYMKKTGMDTSQVWWLPIVSLVAYIITYNFGLGALPWSLVGELFSTSTRALASSLTAFTCLFLAFSMTLVFPSIESMIGFHGVFWFFCANAVLCLVFVLYYVPETKGKTFQEILRMLDR